SLFISGHRRHGDRGIVRSSVEQVHLPSPGAARPRSGPFWSGPFPSRASWRARSRCRRRPLLQPHGLAAIATRHLTIKTVASPLVAQPDRTPMPLTHEGRAPVGDTPPRLKTPDPENDSIVGIH